MSFPWMKRANLVSVKEGIERSHPLLVYVNWPPKPRPRELNTKEIVQNGARMSINMKIADFKLMRMYSGYQTFFLAYGD